MTNKTKRKVLLIIINSLLLIGFMVFLIIHIPIKQLLFGLGAMFFTLYVFIGLPCLMYYDDCAREEVQNQPYTQKYTDIEYNANIPSSNNGTNSEHKSKRSREYTAGKCDNSCSEENSEHFKQIPLVIRLVFDGFEICHNLQYYVLVSLFQEHSKWNIKDVHFCKNTAECEHGSVKDIISVESAHTCVKTRINEWERDNDGDNQ